MTTSLPWIRPINLVDLILIKITEFKIFSKYWINVLYNLTLFNFKQLTYYTYMNYKISGCNKPKWSPKYLANHKAENQKGWKWYYSHLTSRSYHLCIIPRQTQLRNWSPTKVHTNFPIMLKNCSVDVNLSYQHWNLKKFMFVLL